MTDPDPFDMLFRAKWNIPQAAAAMGLVADEKSWEEVKVSFREWCTWHPPTHTSFDDKNHDSSPS